MAKHKTKSYMAEEVYFTADTHYYHKAMLNFRPQFRTVDEMNEALIENHNTLVRPTDTVFHLGDVSFGHAIDTVSVLGQLNGRLVLIRGNHDKRLSDEVLAMFSEVHDYLEIDVMRQSGSKQRICMLHFAMRVWNRSHYGAYHLHGHSHGNLRPYHRSMDVGVDANSLAPISFARVDEKLGNIEPQEVDHHKPMLYSDE